MAAAHDSLRYFGWMLRTTLDAGAVPLRVTRERQAQKRAEERAELAREREETRHRLAADDPKKPPASSTNPQRHRNLTPRRTTNPCTPQIPQNPMTRDSRGSTAGADLLGGLRQAQSIWAASACRFVPIVL
jgi:hypothetical protein